MLRAWEIAVRLMCILLCAVFWAGSATARDNKSGNAMLGACKDSVEQGTGDSNAFLRGACAGVVDALLAVGDALPENGGRFCHPKEVEIGQGIRVAIRFMEKHRRLLHSSFKVLSVMAFHEAWPCKKK
jgi:Ssp1 endopeptidase immunity protein Rap1a